MNHLEEARLLLDAARADVSENWVAQPSEHKSDVLAAAQVHATLALVEQQRIANLIAFAGEGYGYGRGRTGLINDRQPSFRDPEMSDEGLVREYNQQFFAREPVVAEIREGLGL